MAPQVANPQIRSPGLTMADKKTCNEEMFHNFRFYKCGKPAKWICEIKVTDGVNRKFVKGHRCGIHAKRYEKVEKL
jgi:hypothetical protein